MSEQNKQPEHTIYRFNITGGFDIRTNLKEVHSNAEGVVVGFELPDGKIVRPCICLEVEDTNADQFTEQPFKYITSEREMAELGFEGLDYDQLDFFEVLEQN
jgi:hypothetical protein